MSDAVVITRLPAFSAFRFASFWPAPRFPHIQPGWNAKNGISCCALSACWAAAGCQATDKLFRKSSLQWLSGLSDWLRAVCWRRGLCKNGLATEPSLWMRRRVLWLVLVVEPNRFWLLLSPNRIHLRRGRNWFACKLSCLVVPTYCTLSAALLISPSRSEQKLFRLNSGDCEGRTEFLKVASLAKLKDWWQTVQPRLVVGSP